MNKTVRSKPIPELSFEDGAAVTPRVLHKKRPSKTQEGRRSLNIKASPYHTKGLGERGSLPPVRKTIEELDKQVASMTKSNAMERKNVSRNRKTASTLLRKTNRSATPPFSLETVIKQPKN
jgi:hypothetical protein